MVYGVVELQFSKDSFVAFFVPLLSTVLLCCRTVSRPKFLSPAIIQWIFLTRDFTLKKSCLCASDQKITQMSS